MYPFYPPPNPQQPIVFIPSPGTSSSPPMNPLEQIRLWKQSIEELEKAFKKEDKKEDDKKKKGNDVNIVSVVLLMILIAPITGPIMSRFFQWGLSSFPH